MEGIHGSFPGGPSRGGSPESLDRASRLLAGEELDVLAARRSRERERRARQRRRLLGIVVSILVAGGVGVALGHNSRRSADEILAEGAAADRPRDLEISREVNRALLELWRMEEVEALRRTPR